MRLANIMCAVALLYSCNSVEIIPLDEQSHIDFFAQSTTRGTLINSSDELMDFGVYAYTQDDVTPWFMTNVEVVRSGTSWDYSPRQMWPEEGYSALQFFAYAPYATLTNGITLDVNDTTGIPYIYYESPSDVTSHVDLMVGSCSADNVTGCVNIAFSHALAALDFQLSGSGANRVDSLTIEGLICSGVLTMELSDLGSPIWEVEREERDGSHTILLDCDNYTLFVIPQRAGRRTRLTLYSSGEGIEYEFATPTKWQAGEHYTYEIIYDCPIVELQGVENCYIVEPTTTCDYTFDAITRVNQFWGSATTGGVDASHPSYTANGAGYVEIGESDENTILDDNEWYLELIWADFQESEYITFKQTPDNYGVGDEAAQFWLNTTAHGNILIGLKRRDAESYLWSWHIWITDYDPTNDDYTLEAGDNAGRKVMGRNLGATSSDTNDTASYGLYYQWGRKDPFYRYGSISGTESYTDNIHTSTEGSLLNTVYYPENFYYPYDPYGNVGNDYNMWGGSTDNSSTQCYENDKTIYDPCPQGWRVPAGEDWSGFTDNCNTESVQNTLPLAGYRYFLFSQYLFSQGSEALYWSGSPIETSFWIFTQSYCLSFGADFSSLACSDSSLRARALCIRPIKIAE